MSERLRVLFCDHLSIPRGKYLPPSKIGNGATRFARPTYAVHYDKDLLLDAPHTGVRAGLPDMELRWNEADIRPGWEPGTHIVTGDLFDEIGEPLPLCGRGALKRAIAAWQARGLTPKVGIELEAYALVANDTGRLVPYDTPGGVVYGTGPFTDPLRFTDAIWEKAEQVGFHIDVFTAEYDAPQFEFTLTFDDALRAIDDIFLFRLLAREVALDHGIVLTFLPKPVAEGGGSGMHVNLSFADAQGRNAVAAGDGGGPDNMSELARGCIAGWMHHHRGLAGLLAPTANSYQRLQPASLSGYWRNWGGDHRGVTCRISAEGGAKARLEHRMPDASANPYVAVAALLHAARLGGDAGYELPLMETGDCFDKVDAREGVATDLRRAMDDLAADTALAEALGPELVEHHLFMKRKEVKKTRDLEGDALRDFYVWFV
ncbi:MAG: glutamine synthetase [Paracoccaceae bacterium]